MLHGFRVQFLRTHHGYLFCRGFESVRANFHSGKTKSKVVLLVIYLFNFKPSESVFFLQSIVFEVLLRLALVNKQIGILCLFLQYIFVLRSKY